MSKPITEPLDEVEVLMLQNTFHLIGYILILNNWRWQRLYLAISFIGLQQ